MEYTFSTRQKNGSICLILAYKVGKRWRQKTKQGFRTQREARAYQDILLQSAEKEAGLTFDPTLKDITLRQFWGIFKRDKRQELSFTSLRSYESCIKRLLLLLDLPIKEITAPTILNQLNQLHVAVSTRNLTLRTIKVVMEYATVYKVVAVNPARGIKQIVSRKDKPLKAFTKKEVAEILKSFAGNPLAHLVILIAARTGLRMGEVLGLTWDCIDFAHSRISIKQQWGLTGPCQRGLKPCKTRNSIRTIPAPADLMEELSRWKRSQPLQFSGMIFPPKKLTSLSVHLNGWIKKNYPGRSFHAFRHTFATLLLAKTGDINLVASVLGDTVTVVSKTYVNYTQDIRDTAAESIANLY